MGRFLKITLVVLMFSASTAYASPELELLFGPKFDVKNWANQFTVGMAVGGEYIKLGFNYSHASPAGVSANMLKPYLLGEIPIFFMLGKTTEMAIAPTIDFGPEFGFINGVKVIDFAQLGFGLKTKFYFTEHFGVAVTPFHLTTSFATYTTGGTGIVRLTRMTYDLLFSVLLKW